GSSVFHRSGLFFFSSRRRHTRFSRDWSSDVCSSDLQQASTAVFGWGAGAVLRPLLFFAIVVQTPNPANAAMQFDHVSAAGGLVQSVHVLGDEGEVGQALL